jgi:hypothetical protein
MLFLETKAENDQKELKETILISTLNGEGTQMTTQRVFS